MSNELSNFGDHAVASMQANAVVPEGMGIEGSWHVECHDKDGNLKWTETFPNLVVAAGKELMLTVPGRVARVSSRWPSLRRRHSLATSLSAD